MSLPWELEMGSKVVALEAHEGGDRRQIGNGCDGDGEGLSSEKSMHHDGSGANTGAVDIASEELVTRDYIRVMKNIQSWQGRKVSSTRTELRSLSSMSSVTHKSKMGYGSHQEVGGKGNEETEDGGRKSRLLGRERELVIHRAGTLVEHYGETNSSQYLFPRE
ncbi:hypothetical protein ACOSQ3_026858 [Xanthoceras sorbifolium]